MTQKTFCWKWLKVTKFKMTHFEQSLASLYFSVDSEVYNLSPPVDKFYQFNEFTYLSGRIINCKTSKIKHFMSTVFKFEISY